MKNIFLIAIILISNLQIYIQQDVLIDFCLSITQFNLLILYFIYLKIKIYVKDKIIK